MAPPRSPRSPSPLARARRLAIALAVAVAAACDADSPPSHHTTATAAGSGGAPAPSTPSAPLDPADAAIDASLREALAEAVRAARGAGDLDAVVLTDDTPRPDLPEAPGPGEALCFLPGASLRVPLRGLEGVGFALDADGRATLSLTYADAGDLAPPSPGPARATVRVLDASAVDGALLSAEVARLLAPPPALSFDVLDRAIASGEARAVAAGASAAHAAARAEHHRALLRQWDAHLVKRHPTLRRARRAALEADAASAETAVAHRGTPLDIAYTLARKVAAKRLLDPRDPRAPRAPTAGGTAAAPEVFAAGPVFGARALAPHAGAAWVDGPDDMDLRVEVVGAGGEGAPLPASARAALDLLVRSARPYARDRALARIYATEAGAARAAPPAERPRAAVRACLAALAAYHLDRSGSHAEGLLAALRALAAVHPSQPGADGRAGASDLQRLADDLARAVGGTSELRARLRQAAASGAGD